MSIDSVLSSLAGGLRATREQRGLTLDDLAGATGMSKAHLSRIESGERQPAIATLLTLARALDVRVGALLGEDAGTHSIAIHGPAAPSHEARGLRIEPASGFGGPHDLDALRVRVGPDREPPAMASHPGEEWLYVLTGTLVLEHGADVHELPAGTAAHFDATRPHRLSAPHGETELVLVATSPPRTGADRHY